MSTTGIERGSSTDFKASSVAGYFAIGGAALFWGISATLGRAVFTGHLRLFGERIPLVPPIMLAQSRTTFAACILFPVLIATRGASALRMSWRELRDCVLFGTLGIAASNYFYYLSIQRTSVATAIILQYMAPVFVLLWMLGRGIQKPSVPRIAGVFVAGIGSVLAIGAIGVMPHFPWLGVAPGTMRFDLIGVIAALVAALSFAFYNVFGRHLVEAHDRWTVQAWALAGAAAGWLFIHPLWQVARAHYSAPQWGFMLLFSVTSTLIPFTLYVAGLRHLDATRAIVTSCLEPVFSVLIAAFALGEWVNRIQTVGILLVLASTILVQQETGKGDTQPPFEPME